MNNERLNNVPKGCAISALYNMPKDYAMNSI